MSEQSDARIKAEQLAAEKYRIIAIDGAPSGHEVRNAFIDGYLTARTITAEQVKAAAERSRKIDTGEAHGDMRHVLTAAGLLIEGEE